MTVPNLYHCNKKMWGEKPLHLHLINTEETSQLNISSNTPKKEVCLRKKVVITLPIPPLTPQHAPLNCGYFLVLGGLLDGSLLADDLFESLQPHILGGLVPHACLTAVQQGQCMNVLQLCVLHALVHHQVQELISCVVQHLVVLPVEENRTMCIISTAINCCALRRKARADPNTWSSINIYCLLGLVLGLSNIKF